MLVVDGRVVEVGERLARPRRWHEHDAEGRWLVPGLWDQHVHLGQWTLVSHRLDLTGTRSVEEALDRVVAAAGRRRRTCRSSAGATAPPPGTGSRPSRELDAVTGVRPVVLISGDGHNAWLNTVAMRGLRLPERDGVVSEGEWFQAYPRLARRRRQPTAPRPTPTWHTMRQAAAKGVAGPGRPRVRPGRRARGRSGRRPAPSCCASRVGAYVDTLDEFLAAGLRTGDPLPGCGPLVTMGPLKIISDGSLNTRTAWCCAPYADGGGTGAPPTSPARACARVMDARQRGTGLEVAIHAIGDAAVRRRR